MSVFKLWMLLTLIWIFSFLQVHYQICLWNTRIFITFFLYPFSIGQCWEGLPILCKDFENSLFSVSFSQFFIFDGQYGLIEVILNCFQSIKLYFTTVPQTLFWFAYICSALVVMHVNVPFTFEQIIFFWFPEVQNFILGRIVRNEYER